MAPGVVVCVDVVVDSFSWASILVGLTEDEVICEQEDELEKLLLMPTSGSKKGAVWLGKRRPPNDVDAGRCNFEEGLSDDVGESLRLKLDSMKLEADKLLVDRGAPGRAKWAV